MMKLLEKKDEKEIWLNQIKKPYKFISPFDGDAFVCILFNNDPSILNEEQNSISDELIAVNCRYAVCAGINCESLHDAIDWAYIFSSKNFSPSTETMVMTTWHENESIDDIIYFGLNCTNFDHHNFRKYLILFIGIKDGLEEEVKKSIA